jgi:ubiquinone/menaquinone biosynthesis C-methylase UbiE
MARSGYDRLSWCYDALVRIVFGSTLDQAQCVFFHHLPTGSRVLVLGGGTGRFLPRLLRLNPLAKVVYVDSSREMIARASQRVGLDHRVVFVCGTVDQAPPGAYDAVITPFFLDLFDTELLRKVVAQVEQILSPYPVWLIAEFKQEKVWHRVMLGLMYRFFRVTTGLGTRQLPEWEAVLSASRWQPKATRRFYGRFVEGSVWAKPH